MPKPRTLDDVPRDLIVLEPLEVRAAIPTEAENQTITKYLKANDKPLYHCWRLMLHLGARLDDVLTFKTSDIGKVLENEHQRVFVFFESKVINRARTTNRPVPKQRRIPLTPELKKVLKSAYNHAYNLGSEWLIPSMTSGGNVRTNRLRKQSKLRQTSASRKYRQLFDSLIKQNPKSLRPTVKAHSARKLFCQRVYEKHQDWVVVQKAIGHRAPTVTRDYLIEPERGEQW